MAPRAAAVTHPESVAPRTTTRTARRLFAASLGQLVAVASAVPKATSAATTKRAAPRLRFAVDSTAASQTSAALMASASSASAARHALTWRARSASKLRQATTHAQAHAARVSAASEACAKPARPRLAQANHAARASVVLMATALRAQTRIALTSLARRANAAWMGIARLAPNASPGTAARVCAALTVPALTAHMMNARTLLAPKASVVLMGIACRVLVIPNARAVLSVWMVIAKPLAQRAKTVVMGFVNRSPATAKPHATNVLTVTRVAASPLAARASIAAMETARTGRAKMQNVTRIWTACRQAMCLAAGIFGALQEIRASKTSAVLGGAWISRGALWARLPLHITAATSPAWAEAITLSHLKKSAPRENIHSSSNL